MEHKSGCLVCGAELIYPETPSSAGCYYCGVAGNANAECINGHYVCDACHQGSANDLIEKFCVNTDDTDPVSIAFKLMNNPKIKMHGPEHHFLVPAVLTAAYYNHNSADPVSSEEKAKIIKKVRRRAEIVPGGFCGFNGTCGAAIGTGIFISILTKATPLSKQEWKLSNLVTSESLKIIAENGGPRCCKRNTFLAIQTASGFVDRHFGIVWHINEPVVCTFSKMNAECLKAECKFYRG